MDATERTRLRALLPMFADPLRVRRADLADVLNALDAAERERDDALAIIETMRAEAALMREQLAAHGRFTEVAADAAAGAMREAALQACRDALCDPSDIAIIGRVAEALRALPLRALPFDVRPVTP